MPSTFIDRRRLTKREKIAIAAYRKARETMLIADAIETAWKASGLTMDQTRAALGFNPQPQR